MIKLTSLWANKDKNGNLCLSGYLGDAKVMIFANTYKKEDKQPDYIVYLDEKKKDSKKEGQQQSSNNTEEGFYPVNDDDELPF